MHRDDFSMLDNVVYLDNSATTLKPKVLVDAISDYYNNYCSNASRGDYKIALRVDDEIFSARNKVKDFINACDSKEIIFTSNATDSLNKIVFGYVKLFSPSLKSSFI